MCGNALRSVGKYVYDHKLTDKTELVIETLGGMQHLNLTVTDGLVSNIRADIGGAETEYESNSCKYKFRSVRWNSRWRS